MLSLPVDATLSRAERFALELLVDLSAIVPFDGTGDVVRLEVRGDPGAGDVRTLRDDAWGIETSDGVVSVSRSLLGFVADVAGGLTEQRSQASDRFARVPASATRPVRDGFEREPVVSLAALRLRGAARDAAGRRAARFVDPWPDGRRWAAALSHDLDVVAWWPAFTLLRIAELVTKREGGLAMQVAAHAAAAIGRPVVWSAVREILESEARRNVRSTWFVLCGTPTLTTARGGDLTYRPESRAVRRVLDALHDARHEVGLHGSFATSTEPARFGEQRGRLDALAGLSTRGVRQHYLRLRAASTPPAMRDAGFDYDSTYGYADRNGFRLGVADVVPLWDGARDAAVGLDEAPFAWMDRALSKYQGVEEPMRWIEDALALADRCRDAEGMWVGIWHPNLAPALGFPGAPAAYAHLIDGLVVREAYVAPIGELVSWRRSRRALRASAIAADGRVHLSGSPADDAATPFVVRDADGRICSDVFG